MSTIESVRVTEKAKVQLITLKRRTGLKNWNTVCRWAFCVSLANDSEPPKVDGRQEELMDWSTFGGQFQQVYLGLTKQRCSKVAEPGESVVLRDYFHQHLHRGIVTLVGNKSIKSAADLSTLANIGA